MYNMLLFSGISVLSNFSIAAFLAKFQTKLFDILGALVIFFIGYFIIKQLMKPFNKALVKFNVDISFHAFILSVVRISATVILAVSCLEKSGLVESSSLIAALGSVGLAISLAVKDSLTNLAGSMSILFTKPFKVGDYVDIGDKSGTVNTIDIVYTTLKTIDNKLINIPNGDVAKATVVNYSTEPLRRLDLTFSIGYNDDFMKAEKIIIDVINKSGMALDAPQPPFAMVSAHSASSIDILSKTWVKKEQYWDLHFYLMEEIKLEFDKAGINIPYNQLDVHINNINK